MSHEERAHIERLLAIHRASLRELEVQAAKFGELHVPSHITLQIGELRATIAELEAQLTALLPLHNLPLRDYEQFVGRQSELAEVRRLLLPRSRAFVITIDGIGGIGKSSLALEVAYSACDGYATMPEAERFEAIVWVSAKRSYLTADGILERRQAFRALDDLFAAIAQVLDFPAITRARAEEQRAIVEQVLGEQRTLLILDNLETVDDEELMVFLRELPAPTKAIVTTRHRIDVAHPVRLSGMPQQDALALIEQEAARKEVELAPDDHEQLWLRTGGVPLAIVWSIGLMGLGGSVESVLRRLGSGQSDIAQFCFAESVAQIRGRDAYWLLLALSLFASDASREALGIVAGLGEDTFGRDMGLEELLRLSLINKSGDRFSLLPLTRSSVQYEVEQQPEWSQTAQQRQYQHFVTSPDNSDYWYYSWQVQERIEVELPNILAILERQVKQIEYVVLDNEESDVAEASTQFARDLLYLYRVVTRALRIRGHWSLCERLCYDAIALARRVGDFPSVGWRRYDIGHIAFIRDDLTTARQLALECQEAWRLTDIGVHHAERLLGLIAIREGSFAQARAHLTAGYEAYKQSGRSAADAQFIHAFGELALREGNLAKAEEHFLQSIELNRAREDTNNEVVDLLELACVFYLAGQPDQARQLYEESLKKALDYRRVDIIAQAQLALAELDLAQQRYAQSTENARQALDLFRRLGMHNQQAEAEELLRQIGEQV